MRLNPGMPSSRRAAGGFTLLEAVMAAGVVLLTVTAVTLCVATVSRAGARLERRMDADRAVCRVAERLRTLPFCACSYPQAATTGDRASDLVAAAFPHANVARNTASARYSPVAGDEGETGGSFVTLFLEDGVRVTCVARFLAGPDGPVMGSESLTGWDAESASAPPAGTLSVVLGASGAGWRTDFVRSALLRPPVSVTTTAAP
jgi:hypothetical protein